MTDRPILLSAPMVLALRAGRKTQTRRVMKPQPEPMLFGFHVFNAHGGLTNVAEHEVPDVGPDYVPWAVGDRLWVRENWARVPVTAYRMSEGVEQTVDPSDFDMAAIYAAGWERSIPHWRPSIHMPRWASRLTLHVTAVRVERLQALTREDAIAEGLLKHTVTGKWLAGAADPLELAEYEPADAYRQLVWDRLPQAAAYRWDANPFVVALTFDVEHVHIDRARAA